MLFCVLLAVQPTLATSVLDEFLSFLYRFTVLMKLKVNIAIRYVAANSSRDGTLMVHCKQIKCICNDNGF